jgi:CRISPR-associated endonuclease Cas1
MKSKVQRIILNDSGYFLTLQKGCLAVKNIKTKKELEKYPVLEGSVGEIQIASGNLVSTGALVTACYNHIPVIVKTALGNPVGVLVSIDDMSHVITRASQYESLRHVKALTIVKEIVLAKFKGMNEVLTKYGLKRIDYASIEQVNNTYLSLEKDKVDAIDTLRLKYLNIEGRVSRFYFQQIFSLIPEGLRPSNRRGYRAYDGINNTFNLAYRILFNKCFVALIRSKLEPYLGYYHATQYGTPALVVDFMELYRYLADDFVLSYCLDLDRKGFELKVVTVSGLKGKREYLNKIKNREFLTQLEDYFQQYVSIRRVRMGRNQRLNSLIAEEALQLARYLRSEIEQWIPRIPTLQKESFVAVTGCTA